MRSEKRDSAFRAPHSALSSWQDALETDGFALLEGALGVEDVRSAVAEWEAVRARRAGDEAILAAEGGEAYGARNLLSLWPGVVDVARKLRESLRLALGPGAGVVRVLFFDKPPGHSWALPWHKDYNIAVAAHGIMGSFTKPTTKAGVPHVMAPGELLRAMLTARIHLDDVTPENGPLRVIPGSHRFYRPEDDEPRDPVAIHCQAGDVLLMRPLLTHTSGHSKPEAGRHRRVVHVECAPTSSLPDGYRWHDFIEL